MFSLASTEQELKNFKQLSASVSGFDEANGQLGAPAQPQRPVEG